MFGDFYKYPFKFVNRIIDLSPKFEVVVYKLFYKLNYNLEINEARYPGGITELLSDFKINLKRVNILSYSATVLFKINRQGEFEKSTWCSTSLGLDQEALILELNKFSFQHFEPSSIYGIRITSYIKVELGSNFVRSIKIIPCPYELSFFARNQIPFILQ